MYESYEEPLLSRRAFLGRVLRHVGLALLAVLISLSVGMAGYIGLAGLAPVDAFLNAAMILGGMGPVDPLKSDLAKAFAGIYALYSGLFFLVVPGIVVAPFLHRVLHKLNLDDDDESSEGAREASN